MPTFVPVPHGIKLSMDATLNGVAYANVHHLQVGTTPSFADLMSIASTAFTAYSGGILLRQHPSFVLLAFTALDISTNIGAAATHTGAVPGGGSGGPAAANACVVISNKTSRHYRGGHGRTYMSGFVSGDLTAANQWGTTLTTALQTFVNTFWSTITGLTGLSAGAVDHVLVHYSRGHAALVPPEVESVQATVVNSYVGAQRGRTT